MIIVYHENNKITEVYDAQKQSQMVIKSISVVQGLFEVAKTSDSIIVWCKSNLKAQLNIKVIEESFTLKNMMFSFDEVAFLPSEIGYVEQSPFLKFNTSVTYPTWLMSSSVGAIYSTTLLKFEELVTTQNLNYELCSIAKSGMPHGLLCYSEPRLLNGNLNCITKKGNIFDLFKFVKQHYKITWIFLLFLNYILYDKRFPVVAFIRCFLYRRRYFNDALNIEQLQNSTPVLNSSKTIDVIIPTIGRSIYVKDVLNDLSLQTHLPQKVIVVEQNPDVTASSELDFLKTETWPFKIVHHYIQQTGVCNARNLALKDVTADYVYLADDDNRFESILLESILLKFKQYKLNAISMSYLQEGEVELRKVPHQWPTFGAGSSVIRSCFLNAIAFNSALEFGYGEDVDYGMQLRNQGADVIYFPDIKIKHLKAPIGGFRTRFVHPWESKSLQPKPSPTVMLCKQLHQTIFQIRGYKTVYFYNYYKVQKLKNPFRYFRIFKQQWNQSVYWANYLNINNSLK